MRERILAALRKFLIIWGAFSLVAIVGFGAFIAYQLSFGNKSQTDSASTHDVRFVLNACGLGENRIEKVIHSYVSSRSFTSDYLDGYAIKIAHLEIAELMLQNNDQSRHWYRGDKLPPIVSEAVGFAGMWSNEEIPWFPKESELRSENIYVYPSSILTHGIHPTAVELIFVRPSDKMVFYFGSKT